MCYTQRDRNPERKTLGHTEREPANEARRREERDLRKPEGREPLTEKAKETVGAR